LGRPGVPPCGRRSPLSEREGRERRCSRRQAETPAIPRGHGRHRNAAESVGERENDGDGEEGGVPLALDETPLAGLRGKIDKLKAEEKRLRADQERGAGVLRQLELQADDVAAATTDIP
ncbi:unnamed protein product, partial [Scytosiphon promiscuus]